jgi:hypothetical protein
MTPYQSLNIQGLLLNKAAQATQSAKLFREKLDSPKADHTVDFVVPAMTTEASLNWINCQLFAKSFGVSGYRVSAAELAKTKPKAGNEIEVKLFHYHLFESLDLLLGAKAVIAKKEAGKATEYDANRVQKLIDQVQSIVKQTIEAAGQEALIVKRRLSEILSWEPLENVSSIIEMFGLPNKK